MYSISVAERGEAFGSLLRPLLARLGLAARVLESVRTDCDLLVCLPGARVRSRARFRVVLTPGGGRCPLSEEAISYGLSPRDTLTVSSLTPTSLVISIQRELRALDLEPVERQELPRIPITASPDTTLALAGTLLLLGVAPERLPSLF